MTVITIMTPEELGKLGYSFGCVMSVNVEEIEMWLSGEVVDDGEELSLAE